MKWEVIESKTRGETFWDVTNGFWSLSISSKLIADDWCQGLNELNQRPGDATKSLIACAEDALSFVVGGSGPARRDRVTDSLRGTVENSKRLLGG